MALQNQVNMLMQIAVHMMDRYESNEYTPNEKIRAFLILFRMRQAFYGTTWDNSDDRNDRLLDFVNMYWRDAIEYLDVFARDYGLFDR